MKKSTKASPCEPNRLYNIQFSESRRAYGGGVNRDVTAYVFLVREFAKKIDLGGWL